MGIYKKLVKRGIPKKIVDNTLIYLQRKEAEKPKITKNYEKRLDKCFFEDVLFETKSPKKLVFNVEYKFFKFSEKEGFLNKKEASERIKKEKLIEAKLWMRGAVKNPKITVDLSEIEGTRVRMRILGDGWIDNNGNICYFNNDKKLRDQFELDLITLFGETKLLRTGNKILLPKIMSRSLEENLSLMRGSGVRSNPHIDKDIIESIGVKKTEAIKTYFADEGRFHSGSLELKRSLAYTNMKKMNGALLKETSLEPPNVLKDMKLMLESIGISGITFKSHLSDAIAVIDSRNRLMVTVPWTLRFCGKKNLEVFKSKVGFGMDYKDELINEYLKKLKYPKIGRNFYNENLTELCRQLQEKEGCITVANFSKFAEKSISGSRKCISRMIKKEKIKKSRGVTIIRDKKGKSLGTSEFEYKLVKFN